MALPFEDVDFLVMAAGSGRRMGAAVRKQWLSLCGQPLFLFTVLQLLRFGATSVIIVAHPDDLAATEDLLAAQGIRGCKVVVGGCERQESVRAGLGEGTRPYIAVHDAARPFVTEEDVRNVVAQVRASGAATLGHPVRDSLKRVDEQQLLRETIDRTALWQVQTPQVFRRDLLVAAHERALTDGYLGTDDTVLVERLGHAVQIVRGSSWNVKITEVDDVFFMKLWEASLCESD